MTFLGLMSFDLSNSCKRLRTSRLHELHESKFPFVSRIEFIRSKLSNFSAHVSGASVDHLWYGCQLASSAPTASLRGWTPVTSADDVTGAGGSWQRACRMGPLGRPAPLSPVSCQLSELSGWVGVGKGEGRAPLLLRWWRRTYKRSVQCRGVWEMRSPGAVC